MFTDLLNYIKEPSAVHSIDILFLEDEIPVINGVTVSKKKNLLSISQVYETKNSLEETVKQLDKKYPCIFSINGKGVIHREVSDFLNIQSALESILPGARGQDFYIQVKSRSDISYAISVIRKSKVESVIDTLEKQGVTLIGIYLGLTSVENILKEVGFLKGDTFNFSYYSVETIKEEIIAQKVLHAPEKGTFIISNDNVKAEHILAFCNALSFYSEKNKYRLSSQAFFDKFESYELKSLFDFSVKAALSFFFTLLLVNFLVFEHYFDKNTSTQYDLQAMSGKLEEYNRLKKEWGEKQTFFQLNGMAQPSKFSFYADKIAGTIPPSVVLNTIDLSPKVKTDSDSLMFNPKIIFVSGTCKESIEVNTWINQLKRVDWVKRISLNSYSQNPVTQLGEFLIEINLEK